MKVETLPIEGAFLLGIAPIEDERGFFARLYDLGEFADRNLVSAFVQTSISFSTARGTLRGMHYQRSPFTEVKIVRCTAGAIYDVLIDLRTDSPTYCRWAASELTANNRISVYAPAGVAHGFLTLTPNCEVLYMISAPHEPAAAAGVRWDDPAFGVTWPMTPVAISTRDRSYEDYHRCRP